LKNDVAVFCELADMSRSGYYKWLRHADDQDKDTHDYLKIKAVFDKGELKKLLRG
jgi:hypothetical protein